MASNAELLAQIQELTATITEIGTGVDKVGTETDTLIQKIADLEAVIRQGGQSTSEIDAALAAAKEQAGVVKSKVTSVDEKVPDA